MTPDLWERLKPLYAAAAELPEEGRSGYIEQMCEGDPELAHELQALLAMNGSAGFTLDPPLTSFSFFFPSRPAILQPGTMLADRFRIERHLGSGGMGDVYAAVDTQLDHGHIALKTIRPAIADNPTALARFKDEVRLARRVSGPNVCRIHELYLISKEANGRPSAFLTMELLEGATLHDRIAQASPMPLADMRCIAEGLCAALDCIHEAGIIHRDLKPRNVMLVPHAHNASYRVVVMDFGLARAAARAEASAAPSLLGEGQVVGTPSYMAPEQFEGREAGPPTDIYALGLVLYELATGSQPFAAHTPLAAAIQRGRRPAQASSVRADLPAGWDEVIARCLRYDPEQRFGSAIAVRDALNHPHTVVWRFGKHHRVAVPRTALVVCAAVLVPLMVVGAWMRVAQGRQRELAPEAAHWDALGMAALREGSYLKATRLLAMVTARDPTYAVAHAALADAWSELDFTAAAQQEMLLASAPDGQRGLSDLDRRYINAVRSTMVRDYSAATQDYEDILERLPQARKADGYVDLGRIYEKAGKVPETVSSYEKAAKANPDDPAPFLHLGVLRSRLRDPDAAAKAFDRAEALYGAESDPAGLAEVTYQRGYAANETGAFSQAKQYLEQSLAIARQIPSPQLEARSLSQLSTVAYNTGQEPQAISFADEVTGIARENGLEYWATDALVRLGNAHMLREDYKSADKALLEALQEARQNGHPRLEASAELTLASLRYEQDRWDDQVRYAQDALAYYKAYGFLDAADKALILIGRAEREQANFVEALNVGNQIIATATQTHSRTFIAIGEELVGGVLLNLERYPEALQHFQHALEVTQAMGKAPAYQQVHCAAVLWRLGRFQEAQSLLDALDPKLRQRADVGYWVALNQAEMSLSRDDYQGALRTADEALLNPAIGRPDDPSLEQVKIRAEANLGRLDAAKVGAVRLVSKAQESKSFVDIKASKMVAAELALRSGDAGSARSEAASAGTYFASKGMLESQASSLGLQAQAASLAGDKRGGIDLSHKSLDILQQLEQIWGKPAFQLYLARPDRQRLYRNMTALAEQNGAPSNASLP